MSNPQVAVAKPAAAPAVWPKHPIQTEPWYRFVGREARTMWPFLLGFAVAGTVFFQVALGVTEEDIKNSSELPGLSHIQWSCHQVRPPAS